MSAASIATLDILITADKDQARLALSQTLRGAGAALLRVSSGLGEAMAQLRERPAELVVIDQGEAGVEASEFIAALRANRRLASIFVVQIASAGDLSRGGLNVGPDVVLARPLGRNALIQAVEAALLRH